MHSSKSKKSQQDSFQSQIAVGTVKPLAQSVGAAAIAAGADGNGFLAQRERDVSVCRGQAVNGLEAQVGVHRPEHLQDPSPTRKLAARTVPTPLHRKPSPRPARASRP